MRTVFLNGKIYTGTLPLAEAFVIEDGAFLYVGSSAGANAFAGINAACVDLKGQFVCAGFNDSHMHVLHYGQVLSSPRLNEHTHSLEDMLCCLKNYLNSPLYMEGTWLVGHGWNQDYFSDVSREPNRWDLDRVSSEIPVVAVRCCGHSMAVNSKVLSLMHITSETPQPEGGRIGFEGAEPNGLFYDNAMELVYDCIPAPSKEALKQMILLAGKTLNSYGVTSCHSDDYQVFKNVPWQMVNEAFQELEASGDLSVRVYEQSNFTSLSSLKEFINAGNKTRTGSEMFRIGPLKLVGDGSLGARTAYLSSPYSDDPSVLGFPLFSKQELKELVEYAHINGMQIAVHEIGDAGVDDYLASLESAFAIYSVQDHRHGLVHCQITRPDQLQKIEQLGLHIYVQPIFLDYDNRIVEARVGEARASSSYSWKTLRDKGLSVSFGTDCPVELPNALGCIQCSVTRKTLDGTVGPYLPGEAFSIQEAIDAYTIASAEASFEENKKGRIQPGYYADFVVLSENLFDIPQSEIQNVAVEQVYLAGKQVYQRVKPDQ